MDYIQDNYPNFLHHGRLKMILFFMNICKKNSWKSYIIMIENLNADQQKKSIQCYKSYTIPPTHLKMKKDIKNLYLHQFLNIAKNS